MLSSCLVKALWSGLCWGWSLHLMRLVLIILTSNFQLLLYVVLYVAVLSCCMLGVCNIYETHLLWSMWLYVALHYTYHTRYLGSLSFRDHPCVISSRFANPIFPQGHGPGAETQWHHGHEGLDTFHVKLPHRINLKSTAFSHSGTKVVPDGPAASAGVRPMR